VSGRARLPAGPFVYPIVDAALVDEGRIAAVVAALAAAGAQVVQLRAKGLGDRALAAAASAAVAAGHAKGALVVVNDRPDVARVAGADGVHVGQDDMAPSDVRRVLPPPALLGLSTHDVGQVAEAPAALLDYVAIGPVFPTRSKAAADPVVGLAGVAAARAATTLPLVAIGGITRANAAAVIAAGADAVAVISELMVENPAAAFRALAEAVQRGR
jgi:thiamine-phosphate pyrophosphorylase